MSVKFSPGDTIDNTYIVEEAFDEGGFGHAYKVKNGSGYEVLKICKESTGTIEAQRFEQENDFLHRLSPHERIIEPLSRTATLSISHLYYRMKLADYNLARYLENFEDGLNLKQKVDIFRAVCEGLKHAHENHILHRDLHWGNILVDVLNDCPLPKLTDFGRSKDLQALAVLSTSPGVWGEFVCPPEIRFKIWDTLPQNYTEGDIYALGIVFCYLIRAQPDYPSIFKNDIANFTRGKKIDLVSITDETVRQSLYQEWLSAMKPERLNYLSLLINEGAEINQQINATIKKLSHPDFRLRCHSIDEVLGEVSKY